MPPHISIAGYNRLLATKLLPKEVTKIIYLDCDIVLNDDINKIWKTDINNYLLAAVTDSENAKNYFNSGVMLLNLKSLRNFDFYSKWKDYVINHPNISELKYPDQDILNDITKGEILFLSEYYNCRRYVPSKMIVTHYCDCKPWKILCWHDEHLKKLYWQYTDANPWKINFKINRIWSYIKSCKFLFKSSRLIMFPATRLFKEETRHRFRDKFMRKK
jgi:lipopolysaccharide biosynthesis glycosyltransferase